jgi:hypothetical protein
MGVETISVEGVDYFFFPFAEVGNTHSPRWGQVALFKLN